MAIKIIGSTIIDDSRNIVNAGIATVTSVSIGNTQVVSSARQLQNIASLDATTTATIEAAIANAPNTFTDLNVTGISTLGVTSATNLTAQQLNVSGVVTATTFIGALTGTATTATKLENARTFEITGDIQGSAVSFDGTGNVSIAATIQPNSVALGSDTTGDYVQSISGTSNQITVTSGTGESSTPTLSVPNQFTAPQDVTVTRDLQVNRNLNVNGNITIGGTSATIFSQSLNIFDPDIVLGYRTDAFGNDVSNDNTANHGGVAVASTEGTPLVQLFIAGIETNPATYKKIMWFKEGTFSGLGTDAWLSNYAVGIGSTQFPTGTRLAAGSVQFTENDLAVVRNINASGILTSSTANVTTANITTGNIVTGIVTNISGTNLNYTGVGTITRLNSTNATLTNINSSGISTLGVTTFTDAVSFGTSAYFGDNDKLYFGDGNDLEIYHDGSNSFIKDSGTGNLYLLGGQIFIKDQFNSETHATFNSNGAVELYYDNVKEFETTGYGATVFGILQAQGLQVSGVSTFTQISAGGTTGPNQYVLSSTGTGLSWQPVTSVGGGTLNGIIIQDEGSIVGTAGSITTLNFVGTNVTASAVALGNTATITVSDTPNFTTLNVSGVSTVGFLTATNIWNAGITTSSRLTLNGANDTATGGGQIILNGATGNRIDFNTNGVAAPTFTTRSAGTKIVLYPLVSGSAVDYAFGIQSGTLWHSVPEALSAYQFRWYGGTTQLADLKGSGELVIGSSSLTGTASQRLQVNSGAYVSGNLGIGTTNPAATLQVKDALAFETTNTTTTSTTQVAVDTFATATFRSAKYQAQITCPGQISVLGGITTGGRGYTAGTFNVTFTTSSGNGSAAQGTLVVSNGTVGQISVSSGGSGYTAGDVLTASGGSGLQVSVGTTSGTGAILTLGAITSAGIGYTAGVGVGTTTLTFLGGTGTGAVGLATIFDGVITSSTLLQQPTTGTGGTTYYSGSNYSTASVLSVTRSDLTNTITTITGSVGVSTFTSLTTHGLFVNDIIRSSSTSNGLTAGTDYYVVTTPTTTTFTLGTSVGVGITFTAGTSLSIGFFRNSANAGGQVAYTNAITGVSTNHQVSDLLILHNGSTADFVEYATIANDDILGTFAADISGANARLLFTPTYPNNNIKVARQAITV